MIEAVDLSAGYGGRPVIAGVNLSVRRGEFVAVIGPNAAGKTTLLKTLANLLKPLGGVVYISGTTTSRMAAREIARLVGSVLTEQPRPTQLTVFEVVSLGRYPYTNPMHTLTGRDRSEVWRALADAGITHLSSRRLSELSDGQRQKVMIARALAQEPRVLILDEPVTYLDPKARVEILLTVKRVARERGIAVIASLHEVELALRMADRLIVVSGGRVALYDSPEEFVALGGPIHLYGLDGESTFSPELMSVEFRPRIEGGPRLFIVAGGGSGSLVYRMLARLGYQFSTGVLHEGDIDYYVASLLGGVVITEQAFQPISPESVRRALEESRDCAAAIYTSPPIGPLNSANHILAETIAQQGIPLIVLGPAEVKGVVARARSLADLSKSIEMVLENSRAVEPLSAKR
ncbi:Ferric enterobactin transport ATP-binding protein FepC [Candidatus Calditenuaceae archaeon HR02]|nr:Ferric enterobactin transport ATP-binding protein FepC [Candidatus Calditenuaceae archaeon HR02]